MTKLQKRGEKAPRFSRITKVAVVIAIAGLGYIVGANQTAIFTSVAGVFGAKVSTDALDVSQLQQTYRTLKANYDGNVDKDALIQGAQRGMVAALGDEYTVYLDKKQATEFQDSLSGSIGGGVGIEVGLRDGIPTVVRLLRDNPAEKAGIQAGDKIALVNGEEVNGQTVEQIVSKIRGEAGTTLKLGVVRGNEAKEFSLTRAIVNNPSVYSSVQDGVGVITITRFDDQTGALARRAAQDFKSQNVRGVVLDLRGNGGGYVSAAQDVAGIWLNNKVVVTEKSNGKVVDELTTGRNTILEGIPTVVLANESSASASEIVAGALRDHGAARLVGTKTFGKGSVQQLLSLPDGAELKVTIAKWFTPKGVNISKEGLKPDVELAYDQAAASAGNDTQLKAAEALLR